VTTDEWLRTVRGWLCYAVVIHLQMRWWWPGGAMVLVPYAGDWEYRKERRELTREQRKAQP